MKASIAEIQLSHYRSCKKTAVKLQSNLSALIGINAAGKSNFLSGILLLKKIGSLRPRHTRESEEFFQSKCKIKTTFLIGKKRLPFEASVKYTTNERNVDEVTDAQQTWNFEEFTGDDTSIRLPMSWSFDSGRFEMLAKRKPDQASEKQWLAVVLRGFYPNPVSDQPIDATKLRTISTTLDKVSNLVSGIKYYSASQFTDPSRCPTYFEIESERGLQRINRPRSEHLQFMYDLYSASIDSKSKYEEFMSIVGKDGIGLIDTIKYDTIEVPSSVYDVRIGGRVIRKEIKKLLVIPSITVKGFQLSPNQLSEGTFKTLALVFYLVTDTSPILLLEEPEVCVHHGLLASIMDLIKVFSDRKQIIISTHSDFVLDGLDPEDVFIVRNDAKRGTTVKRVPDSMSSGDYVALRRYLNTSGNLGEIWRHGELEK